MKGHVSFVVSKKDRALLSQIVDRAMREFHVPANKRTALDMDLTACVANGCRLDLARLLTADRFNFAHDVCGIRAHINRETGKLEDNFLPRTHLVRKPKWLRKQQQVAA